MKKIALLIAALVFTIGMSTLVFGDVPMTIDGSKYKVKWSDEFNGTALNTNVWTTEIGNGGSNPGWGNQEKEYYKAENASVSNGSLVINSKYEYHAGYERNNWFNFSSARLVTRNKVELGYGYIEARIRIPSAKGIWPAFWMMGNNGLVWPRCGEIDIMESFNTRIDMQSTIHYPRISDENDLCNYCKKDNPTKTEWHTYGCYRDGSVVAFYIDRQLVDFYNTADGTYSCYQNYPWQYGTWEGRRSVLNDDQYLLLNVACGGNLAGSDPNTDLDENMYVDYVRHYVYDPVKPTNKTTTVSAPAKAKIKKLKNVKKRKIKVSLKKIKGASGYLVRWCDNKKFDGYEEKKTKKTSITLKKLDKKSTYWVKARAYKVVKGVKYWGNWSASKKKKVKK